MSQLTASEAQQNLTALEHLALSRRSLLAIPRHAALHAQGLLQSTPTSRSLLWGTLVADSTDAATAQIAKRRLPTYFEQHSPACKACATPLVPGITSHRSRSGKQRCTGCSRNVDAWSAQAAKGSKQQLPSIRKRRKVAAAAPAMATPLVAAPRAAAKSTLEPCTLVDSASARKLKKSSSSTSQSATSTFTSSSSAAPRPASSSSRPSAAAAPAPAPLSPLPHHKRTTHPAHPRTLDEALSKKKRKKDPASSAGGGGSADKAALRAMLASSKRKEEEQDQKKKGGGLMGFLGSL